MATKNVSNAQLRRRAWELCRKNYALLAGVAFGVALVRSGINYGYALIEAQNELLSALMNWAGTLLIMPIISLGLLQVCADVWHGEPSGFGAFLKHIKKIPRILGIGLLLFLMFTGMLLGMLIVVVLLGIIVPPAGLYILAVLCFIILLWLFLRVSPAYTAFILDPDRIAVECISAAWRASKGFIGRICCHDIVLSLPSVLCSLVIDFFLPNSSILSFILHLIVQTLLFGYVQLGLFALYEYILTGGLPSEAETEP